MKRYYVNAQWIRFICAIYLVVYHSVTAMQTSGDDHQGVLGSTFGLGFFATSVFLVLSGFLLSHAYAEFKGNDILLRGGTRRFMINRISAIYPIHLLSLLLYLVLAWSAGKAMVANFGGLEQFLGRAPWQKVELDAATFSMGLVLSVTLLQAWNPEFLSLNGASWSLSTLLFFYAVFPLIMPLLLKVRRRHWLLVTLIVLYSLPAILLYAFQIDGTDATGMMHRNPLLRLPEFAAGIVLFGIVRDRGPKPPTSLGMVFVLGALLCVSLLLAGAVAASGSPYVWYLLHNGALLPSSLLLVYLAAVTRDLPAVALGTRLGNASLCIFALHGPVGLVFKMLLARPSAEVGACPAGAVACAAGLTPLQSLGVFLLFLASVIVLALAAQRYVVSPAARLLRSRFAPVPSDPPALTTSSLMDARL